MSDATPPTDPNLDVLRRFLEHNDARCPICNYDLKGTASPQCPECGNQLLLVLKPAKPRCVPWLIVLAALSAGFAMPLANLIIIAIESNRNGWYDDLTPVAGFFAAQVVLFTALLVPWLFAENRVRRLHPVAMTAISLTAWAAAIGIPLAIVYAID